MNIRYWILILILGGSIVIIISKPWWPVIAEDELVSTIAIFTAIVSAFGLVISHIVTAHEIKQQSDAKFLEITHNISGDLGVKFNEASEIKGKDKKELRFNIVSWVFGYLDSLDEVAYVKKKDAIPSKLTDYFGPGWFGMAKSLMVWHDEVVTKDEDFIEFRSAIETWPHVYEHCFKKDNHIKPIPPKEFPQILLKEFKEIDFATIEEISIERVKGLTDDLKDLEKDANRF